MTDSGLIVIMLTFTRFKSSGSFLQRAPFYSYKPTDWRAQRYALRLGKLILTDCRTGRYSFSNLWRVEPFFISRMKRGSPEIIQKTDSGLKDFTYKRIRDDWPVLVTFYESYYERHTSAVVSNFKRRTRWYRKCWSLPL